MTFYFKNISIKSLHLYKSFTLIVILFTSLNGSSTIYRITPSGAGNLSGSSWANASAGNNLQTIIDNAFSGDEIWVACGTYVPTTSTDRSISFNSKNGVAIYGGFLGNELSLSARDLSCNSCSILSGEIGTAGNSDNSYTIVRNELVDSTTILDGFVISDANDDRTPTSNGNGLGGGIYNHGFSALGYSHPTIKNCFITNNSASWGAGAFNNGKNGGNTEPTFINCIFYQNHAYVEGGGMDSYGVGGNASPIIINSIFYENTAATNIGGMYAWGGNSGGNSHPLLINCVFVNNVAQNGYGGAFIANNIDENGSTSSGSCTVTLQNCIVWGNIATGSGPQFYVRGTGAQVFATYSDIDTNYQTIPNIISGTAIGNLSENPLFNNISSINGTDNCLLNLDDGLQLSSSSPCIDAGNNTNTFTTDIIGDIRINSSIVDMGAYEYKPTTLIENLTLTKPLKLYPNPIINWVTIETKFTKNDNISVYNILGKKVLPSVKINELNKSVLKINMGALPKGLYIIKINNILTKTVSKQD
jgi:hypothetical protein